MVAKYATCKKCGTKVLRVSWSSLRSHMECRQIGHLKRQGNKSPLQNTRNFFPGNVTDRTVRKWLENDPHNNPNVMPQMVEQIINEEKANAEKQGNSMVWKDRGDKDIVLAQCIEAVTKIEPALNKFVLPFEYQADYKFEVPLDLPHPNGGRETVMLLGYMDIIVKDGKGDWAVWDVKHTRDEYYWKKTAGQVAFYDLAVDLIYGKPTKIVGLLQPLCKKRVRHIPLDEAGRTKIMTDIAAMATDIWKGDVEPRNDTKFCTFCPMKHACPKFKAVEVQGRRTVPLFGG